METSTSELRERVARAAEASLKKFGSVGPLELFQFLGFLQPVHFEAWRKGREHYGSLEEWFQVGPQKFEKTLQLFRNWTQERGLTTVQAHYTRTTPAGIEELRVTQNADPEREKFFRTHYAPANLSKAKASNLASKLNRPAELVVFEKVSEEGECTECGTELQRGDYLSMEKGKPLCLTCADLGHLAFLPAGDTALTRRARKYSSLFAVVLKFSRSRKRYERQGLLLEEAAIARAEAACVADAPERAAARARAKALRCEEDREFIKDLVSTIGERYPGCPPEEIREIAEHTGLRGSGRVGRSTAGRELDERALDLAVIAHIRHTHTDYDELLMTGTDRLHARSLVRSKIDSILAKWRTESS